MRLLGSPTVDAFARDVLKCERSAVSNWLNGGNFPKVQQMAVLCERVPGLTMDWIYMGKADAMPYALAIRLEALLAEMDVPLVAADPVAPEEPTAQAHPRPTRKPAT